MARRARLLRAARAAAGIGQAEAAAGGGVSEQTLYQAERGAACSDKTWTAMIVFFAARGIGIGCVGDHDVIVL